RPRVRGTKPSIGCPIEDEISRGGDRSTHHHEFLGNFPDFFAMDGIPGNEATPIAVLAINRGALHLHAVIRRARYIRGFVVGKAHANIEYANIEQASIWAERRWFPVLLANVRRTDPVEFDAGLWLLSGVDGRPSGLHVKACRPVLVC